MNNYQFWYQELKKKRIDYGISQNKLSTAVGMNRGYLSKVENGKAIPTDTLKEKIQFALDSLNPYNTLEMLFDYVRIRFPTTDYEDIIQNVLRLKIDYMIHEDFGYYSYQEHYVYGDIKVMISDDVTKGTLLELKGRGCRQFESYLIAQQRSWFDFFRESIGVAGVFKRIDLAIDDKAGILDIPELARKCKREECISVFRSYKNYSSGELVHRDEKENMGNTLYIGSLKSEVYFCVYEKDYEQYVKNNIEIEDAKVKNRFEIRLKNERAKYAIEDLLGFENPEKTAFEIINRYIRFADRDDTKDRWDWKTNEKWDWFIGKYRNELRLTTRPEPYTYERTINWLQRQVAPTLKMVRIIDSINKSDVVETMIQEARLTDRHEKLLRQQAMNVEDVIVNDETEKGK